MFHFVRYKDVNRFFFFSEFSAVLFLIFQVDAHNIVPVWVASDKQEIGKN